MSSAAQVDDLLKRYRRTNPRFSWNILLDLVITLALTVAILIGLGAFQQPHRNLLKSSGAVALTASELIKEVKAEKVVAYWLGPISGSKYSLVTTNNGEVVITYLSNGQGIENPQQRNLEIETRTSDAPKDALVAAKNEFTNKNDRTRAGNIFSFDTTIMNFMSVKVAGNNHHVLVYYPSSRNFQNLETDAESLIRIS